jgi:hypothetical protein
MPRWPVGGSTPSGCAGCSPATRWPVGSRSTRWMSPPGRAATLSARPSAASTITRPRHSAGQSIVAGWAFQGICQLGFARDSWTAPGGRPPTAADRGHRPHRGRADRRAAGAAAHHQAATAGCVRRRLRLRPAVAGPGRRPGGGAGAAAVGPLLLRRPATPPPGAGGRPRRHGAKFNCANPTTWPTPTAALTCQDEQDGAVTVPAWAGLHPKQQPGDVHRTARPDQ